MNKTLIILALFTFLFISESYAQSPLAAPRIERAIIHEFPLEQIWANTLLKLNLSDKKIIRLRPVFKRFWVHRQQMMESATSKDRAKVRDRTDALKYKLEQELAKHLQPGQIRAVIPQPQRSPSSRQTP